MDTYNKPLTFDDITNLIMAFYCKKCQCYDCHEHSKQYKELLKLKELEKNNRPIKTDSRTLGYYIAQADLWRKMIMEMKKDAKVIKLINEIEELGDLLEGKVKIYLADYKKAMSLLRNLADLQNGTPLVEYEEEWRKTMDEIYAFLNEQESE